jgi:hypothetical protein
MFAFYIFLTNAFLPCEIFDSYCFSFLAGYDYGSMILMLHGCNYSSETKNPYVKETHAFVMNNSIKKNLN